MTDSNLLRRWILATWLGWLLGIPLIAALALAGEAVGIGGVQVLVGAGMGIGIGLTQGRVMRGILGKCSPWFWSSVVGLAVPFLVADVAKAVGWNLGYSLAVCVVAGGLVAGGWQALLLRSSVRGWGWWVAASGTGWLLASGTAWAADALFRSHSVRGIGGLIAYLGIIAAGGLVLGAVTGPCLAWLSRQERAD